MRRIAVLLGLLVAMAAATSCPAPAQCMPISISFCDATVTPQVLCYTDSFGVAEYALNAGLTNIVEPTWNGNGPLSWSAVMNDICQVTGQEGCNPGYACEQFYKSILCTSTIPLVPYDLNNDKFGVCDVTGSYINVKPCFSSCTYAQRQCGLNTVEAATACAGLLNRNLIAAAGDSQCFTPNFIQPPPPPLPPAQPPPVVLPPPPPPPPARQPPRPPPQPGTTRGAPTGLTSLDPRPPAIPPETTSPSSGEGPIDVNTGNDGTIDPNGNGSNESTKGDSTIVTLVIAGLAAVILLALIGGYVVIKRAKYGRQMPPHRYTEPSGPDGPFMDNNNDEFNNDHEDLLQTGPVYPGAGSINDIGPAPVPKSTAQPHQTRASAPPRLPGPAPHSSRPSMESVLGGSDGPVEEDVLIDSSDPRGNIVI